MLTVAASRIEKRACSLKSAAVSADEVGAMTNNTERTFAQDYDAGFDAAIGHFRELRGQDRDAFRMALRSGPNHGLTDGVVVDLDAWDAGWRDALDSVVDSENEARGIDNRYGENNRY